MVVVRNRGGIFCYPGAEDNGGTLSIAPHGSEDFRLVKTNRKLVREKGQRVEFLKDDCAITLAEKMTHDARVVFAFLNIYAENVQGRDRRYGGGGGGGWRA